MSCLIGESGPDSPIIPNFQTATRLRIWQAAVVNTADTKGNLSACCYASDNHGDKRLPATVPVWPIAGRRTNFNERRYYIA